MTQIINEIKRLIHDNDGSYSDWYVGIASEPRERLFNDHNVDEQNGIYDYWNIEDSETAREIERYCIKNLGTDGGTGGGDDSSKYVYAYKKTSLTKE